MTKDITNSIIKYDIIQYDKEQNYRKGEYGMGLVEKYGRILLPLITPYDENEEVDYGKYEDLTKRTLHYW